MPTALQVLPAVSVSAVLPMLTASARLVVQPVIPVLPVMQIPKPPQGPDSQWHRGAASPSLLLLTLFHRVGSLFLRAPAANPTSALCSPSRPRRLARPRTPPFHGDNTGSNPVGDAKPNHQLSLLGQNSSHARGGASVPNPMCERKFTALAMSMKAFAPQIRRVARSPADRSRTKTFSDQSTQPIRYFICPDFIYLARKRR
jgi:hypothetical protein